MKEEVARLESEVAVIREEADTVTRWLGEAKTERAAADERADVSADERGARGLVVDGGGRGGTV